MSEVSVRRGKSWDQAVSELTAPGAFFALTEAVIAGERMTIFEKTPPSLRAVFDSARGRGDNTYIVYEDERWSFADVMKRVDELSALMMERFDIRPGDRVAIAMRNYPEWILGFAAITSIGAIAVCLNAWWTTDELAYGLEDSGAKLVLADLDRARRIAPVQQRLAVRVLVARSGGAELPAGALRMEDQRMPGARRPDVQIHPDDDVTILYTSGTTGRPKGAVSTHRALLSALLAFACRASVYRAMNPPAAPHPWPTSFILTVPLFHVTGLVPVMLSSFASGCKLVMMHKWSPERALELIERERVTQFVGVPTMTWDLLESPDFARRDTSSLTNVGGGGAPAPPELVSRVDKSFRHGRPGIGYGMTETNAYGPQNSGDDYVRKPRSTGRAVPVLQMRVTDSEGKEVPRGQVGEIWFRGANLIRGYWNKPEATAETIVNGWLRSGDIGRMDEEGFITVEDRAKDMVLRAGENVFCAEVEAAIYEYPDVHEVAVFGIPHPRMGEEVAASILPKAGHHLDVDALRAHLATKLANFKIPTRIEITTEPLPRNASGKILKRELRDRIAATPS